MDDLRSLMSPRSYWMRVVAVYLLHTVVFVTFVHYVGRLLNEHLAVLQPQLTGTRLAFVLGIIAMPATNALAWLRDRLLKALT